VSGRAVKTSSPRRAGLGLTIAVLALLTLAPGSLEAGSPAAALQFSHLPTRAVAGHAVSITVTRARAGALCSLGVSYGRDVGQSGLSPKAAVDGFASWSWTIPSTVQANVARLNVACAGSKKLSAKLLVVGGLIPPRMSVEKDGFSLRTSSSGSTDVSYGVVIRNNSPNADALNVNVLVNFVLADDHLLGSTSATIPVIAAGSTYNLGSNFAFPAAAPIARLEIVMQVGGSTRHAGHPPALDNVVIEPSLYDKGWLSDVAGEVINNDPSLMLQRTAFSVVILDSAGNVLGGGSGSSNGALPPGTRMVFKLMSGGFRDILVEKAASVLVTATPTWGPPAS
jgi:hypothetical protein